MATHTLSVAQSCRALRVSRASYYRPRMDWVARDSALVTALHALVDRHPRRGFWKCYKLLRRQGHSWNHKRVYRVYCALGLNHKRRATRRVPARVREPLRVPSHANRVWSADFMSDALYHGTRFRTFNVIDDWNREALAIEVDTSLRASRIIRVFERLKAERGLPEVLRVDNGPEFLSGELETWASAAGMRIQHIQPGKPNQNAFIERFNRTYREEVLDVYLFRTLNEVREMSYQWLIEYNEQRPHDSLEDRTPVEYRQTYAGTSSFELSP